uniref:Uncharacterized protein n=1 Tax=Panagrellus redivivus TaxID=6233 RepID=A0A7E4V0Q8_PANRE
MNSTFTNSQGRTLQCQPLLSHIPAHRTQDNADSITEVDLYEVKGLSSPGSSMRLARIDNKTKPGIARLFNAALLEGFPNSIKLLGSWRRNITPRNNLHLMVVNIEREISKVDEKLLQAE